VLEQMALLRCLLKHHGLVSMPLILTLREVVGFLHRITTAALCAASRLTETPP
jgi:hypothetical protein